MQCQIHWTLSVQRSCGKPFRSAVVHYGRRIPDPASIATDFWSETIRTPSRFLTGSNDLPGHEVCPAQWAIPVDIEPTLETLVSHVERENPNKQHGSRV